MDWGRIKTIFIIIFLVVDLALGGFYFYSKNEEKNNLMESRDMAIEYAKEEGVVVLASDFPWDTPKLPTLSVKVSAEGEGESETIISGKETYEIVVTGKDGLGVLVEAENENTKKISSASKALAKLVNTLPKEEREKGVEILKVSLVYWVELSEGSTDGQRNAAIPSWMFETKSNEIYLFRAD